MQNLQTTIIELHKSESFRIDSKKLLSRLWFNQQIWNISWIEERSSYPSTHWTLPHHKAVLRLATLPALAVLARWIWRSSDCWSSSQVQLRLSENQTGKTLQNHSENQYYFLLIRVQVSLISRRILKRDSPNFVAIIDANALTHSQRQQIPDDDHVGISCNVKTLRQCFLQSSIWTHLLASAKEWDLFVRQSNDMTTKRIEFIPAWHPDCQWKSFWFHLLIFCKNSSRMVLFCSTFAISKLFWQVLMWTNFIFDTGFIWHHPMTKSTEHFYETQPDFL